LSVKGLTLTKPTDSGPELSAAPTLMPKLLEHLALHLHDADPEHHLLLAE